MAFITAYRGRGCRQHIIVSERNSFTAKKSAEMVSLNIKAQSPHFSGTQYVFWPQNGYCTLSASKSVLISGTVNYYSGNKKKYDSTARMTYTNFKSVAQHPKSPSYLHRKTQD